MSRALAALLLALLVAPAFFASAAAAEQERIKNFLSEIEIRSDGTMQVRETLVVHADGLTIKRGILRDIPTRYRDTANNLVKVRFDVVSVRRNGTAEPYQIESLSNGIRVRVGDANVMLPKGDHVYELTFETNRQLGFFEDHDELYWNVTGTGWTFAIENAEAVVRLPPGANVSKWAAYTGPEGSIDQNARRLGAASGNVLRIGTTRPLRPYEGLTIVVAWPKGFVREPSSAENATHFLADNLGVFAAILGLLVLTGYYVVVWDRVGRDPEGGQIIPLFSPPNGFSPAAVRFVRRMGDDRVCFAAALISLAVKGAITIQDDDSTYTLTRNEKPKEALSLGEREIMRALFGTSGTSGTEIALKQANHTKISSATSALRKALQNEYETKYFLRNAGYFYGGLGITGVAALIAALLFDAGSETVFLTVWLAAFTVASGFLLYQAFDRWQAIWYGAGGLLANLLQAIPATFMALVFTGVTLGAGVAMIGELHWAILIALVAAATINLLFYHLLKAPTRLGAKIRAEIEGFRMYLATAERERLAILNPPEMTPALFEKFLPYALALDVDHEWSEQFAKTAARAGEAAQVSTYHPAWYAGNRWSDVGTRGFASALGASIATAAAAASTAPGRSSGFSSGGGFSGGGGGGGGGSGW